MKILLLGHYEIASNYAISLVANSLYQEHNLTIMLSGRGDAFEETPDTIKENTFSSLARYEQELCDQLNAGINSLGLNCDSFDALAEKTNQTIELLEKPNSDQARQKVAELEPELIISIRYRKILKDDFIAIPSKGIINLHSGRLPEYRGAMATFWSMLNAESLIGSTLHFISDGTIDTGNIIALNEQACDYSRSYFDNVLSLYLKGGQNVIQAVNTLAANNKLKAYSQPLEGAYYSFPQQADLERFCAKGLVLFAQ